MTIAIVTLPHSLGTITLQKVAAALLEMRRVEAGRDGACITVNRKQKFLGHFKNAKEAARKYNEAALHYFGEFAVLNPV